MGAGVSVEAEINASALRVCEAVAREVREEKLRQDEEERAKVRAEEEELFGEASEAR